MRKDGDDWTKLDELRYRFSRLRVVDTIHSFFCSIIYGTENLFRYSKLVWKDRDWDYYYFYLMLQFKINSMLEHHKKYNPFEDKEKTVADIQKCKDLLDRLVEDDYDAIASDMTGFDILNKNSDRDELLKYCELVNKLRTDDRIELFRLLSDNIEGWWI